jgi:sugar phosphate isomerase/epimerase
MNRRNFLVGTAAGAAAIAGFSGTGLGQGAAQRRGGAAQGRGGRGGRGPSPANVPAHKLARISMMTLQFGMYRIPTREGAPRTPDQTLTVMDLPKMVVDYYGVHNLEFQLGDVRPSETDPNFIRELKAKLDEQSVTMSQINMEIGGAMSMAADAAGRRQGIDLLKKWVDIANQYGCKRLMLNQSQNNLTKEKRADAVAYLKEVADAGRPSGVMFSVETRGAGNAELIANLGMKPWEFMIGIVEDAGANSTVDIGNVGAQNQQELHDCIRAWHPYSNGNMHIKSNPNWDMGKAVTFAESLGYTGLYALEINNAGHGAIRIAYNTILANIA